MTHTYRIPKAAVIARRALALLILPLAALLWQASARTAEPGVALPAPQGAAAAESTAHTAVFAGGCFWGVEGVFEHVEGVEDVVSGYAGDDADSAHYETVTRGGTNHAESVRISYDPSRISYGELLRIFFSVAHDPTQLNRQGPDRGTHYRSNIFAVDDTQAAIAQAYIEQLEAAEVFERPIVTRIDPLEAFYPAESYHQDYLAAHPTQPYIVINDLPKIAELERLFPERYRGN